LATRVAELHRQAESDRLIQAAADARRARTESRRRSRRPLAWRVLMLRGARTAPAR
jgi:hypothetical protein